MILIIAFIIITIVVITREHDARHKRVFFKSKMWNEEYKLIYLCSLGPESSDDGITNPLCGSNLIVPQEKGVSFFCRPSLFGQYVTIRVRSSDPVGLSLCEVEVYSARRGADQICDAFLSIKVNRVLEFSWPHWYHDKYPLPTEFQGYTVNYGPR